MAESTKLNAEQLRKELINTLQVLISHMRNPVVGMKNLPDWSWPKLVFLTGALAASCGVLNGILRGVILGTIAGLFVYPISTLVMLAVLSGLFYYTFLFFFRREFSFKLIFAHLVFASVPAIVLSTITAFLPPISLLGVAITGLLLIVGFVENFQLPRKSLTKLMSGIFLIYVMIWVSSSISFHQSKEQYKKDHRPINTEILEKEFGSGN